jgi:Flp pilus assembly protein TadG
MTTRVPRRTSFKHLVPAMSNSSRLHILRQRIEAFVGDARGNIAVLFSLALIPVMLLAGAAIDYSRASAARTKLNAAADSAALAAVDLAAIAKSAGTAERTALRVFKSNMSGIVGAKIRSVEAEVTEDEKGRTVVVSYTADVGAAFLGLLGQNTIAVAGSATAASAPPTYIDFHLLLDNTPSMGLGATMADIDRLVANTPDKCAFACHDLSAAPNDYYGLAKTLGVQMRIDVVRQATQKLMDTAAESELVDDQFRVAIYTFGAAAPRAGLTTVQPLTADLSGAKRAANDIDLMTIPYQNYASDTQTDFGAVFTGLDAAIAKPGAGHSGGSRQQYVFFVSDGVADRAVGSPACARPTRDGTDPQTGRIYVRCQEPIDVRLCMALKDRGIKVAVLYTTYLPLPNNGWYTDWIAPFAGRISPQMQSCASPGLFFEVSPTAGISEAMTALFKKAILQARLTR